MDTSDPVSIAIDVLVVLSSGPVILSLKILFRNRIYNWFGSTILKLPNERLVWHFAKQSWGLTWHFSMFTWSLCAVISTSFWTSVINPYGGTSLIWEDANSSNHNLPPLSIRLLYLFQFGYYGSDLIWILVKDRPNDLLNMCIHHIATLCLLLMSYLPSNCWQVGVAILLIHDVADVFLYLCKTLHYAQYKTVSEILFVFVICVWIWSRIIWFPRIIISLYIDIDDIWSVWQVIPCSILLWTLEILHIYWTFLMIRVLLRAIKGEEMKDDRDKKNPLGNDKVDNDKESNNAVIEMETESLPSKQQIKDTMEDGFENEDDERRDEVSPVSAGINTPRKPPSLHRKRSSLVESFIMDSEHVVVPDDDDHDNDNDNSPLHM